MKTNLLRHAFRAALIVLALLVTSCGDDDDTSNAGLGDDGPTFNGLDPTLSCPAGRVGWNFATGGQSLDTAQGSALSGIQVTEMSYGVNCNSALGGNGTRSAAAKCNGQYHCEFTTLADKILPDTAPNCAKALKIKWKCGADSDEFEQNVPAEAGNTRIKLDCGPKVNIRYGTWGTNCRQLSSGAHAAALKAACDGRRNCVYKVQGLEDYVPGCAKNYQAEWTCGDSPKIYTQTTPPEANGKEVYIACDGTPTVKVQSVEWGANVAAQLKIDTTGLRGLWTSTAKNQCDDLINCNFAYSEQILHGEFFPAGFPKDLKVTYTCGGNPTVLTAYAPPALDQQGRFPNYLGLSCIGASAYVAPSVVAEGKKACVPKTCAWNQVRDANMECVGDRTTQRIEQTWIETYSIKETESGQTPIAFVQNTPYDISVTALAKAAAGHWQLTPWLTAQYSGPKGVVDGFICNLPPIDMDNSAGNATAFREVQGLVKNNILPPACFDSRANPAADAAKRLKIPETEIRTKYSLQKYALHFSVDPEGKWGLFQRDYETSPATAPLKPNPPGFFYDQDRDYLDLVSYYKQRELQRLDYGLQLTGFFRYELTPYYGRPLTEATFQGLSTRQTIATSINAIAVTDGSYLKIDYFEPAPAVSLDINWTLAGDWPLHPASPANVNSPDSLKKKNLRATVLVYPDGDEGGAMTIGSVPLDNPNPTGATKSPQFTLPDTVKDAVFSKWSGAPFLNVKACIDVDGKNTRNGTLSYSIVGGNTVWSVEVKNGTTCRTLANAIFLSRSITRKPFVAERSSSNLTNTKSNNSGDGTNSSSNDSGSDKSCSRTGSTTTCTATSRGNTSGSGNVSNSLYSAQSSAERVDGPTKTTATPKMTAEAFSFQVIDVEDDSDKQEWVKGSGAFGTKDSQKLSLAPNWTVLTAGQGGPVKLAKGKYGGQDGLGVSFGLRVPFGGFGLLEIGFDIGVSVSLDFELKFQPDNEYPCIRSDGKACFALTPGQTQSDASKWCRVRGGKLAEMNTAQDRNGILATIPVGSAADYWLGGQLAYRYGDVQCARNPSTAACKNNSDTDFRWIGTDKTFATVHGFTAGIYPQRTFDSLATDAEVHPLTTNIPNDAGVVYRAKDATLATVALATTKQGICEFQPAASVDFSQWSLALKFGAGAGVHLQFCTPAATGDVFGLCIRGQLNFVDASIAPQYGHSSFTLHDPSGRAFAVNGNTFLDIPWKVNLLAGRVDLTANLFFFTTTWTLAEYEGFRAASGSIYRIDSPTHEDL